LSWRNVKDEGKKDWFLCFSLLYLLLKALPHERQMETNDCLSIF